MNIIIMIYSHHQHFIQHLLTCFKFKPTIIYNYFSCNFYQVNKFMQVSAWVKTINAGVPPMNAGELEGQGNPLAI